MKTIFLSWFLHKRLIVILPLFIGLSMFSQTKEFNELTQKTKQSYLDRGYKLVNYTGDSIQENDPLVTPILDFDYNKYYIVLVMLDGCIYCDYKINYVDKDEYLLPINYEFINENGLKQAICKFQNDVNKTGKYVVFLDSDLPYYANIFVFMKD